MANASSDDSVALDSMRAALAAVEIQHADDFAWCCRPPRANTRSGTHSTWRMPMAIVPPCAPARSPSSRSPTMRLVPVSNTSRGILLLVVNDVPGQREAAAAARGLELELAARRRPA